MVSRVVESTAYHLKQNRMKELVKMIDKDLNMVRMISSTLFLFFRIILVILTHLIFHINFRTVMSIATKNLSWIVRGIMLNYVKLVHHFQES